MSIKKVYLFYCLLFVGLAVMTLNLNYVEGDDAQTILYHAFGRDASFQPPYSPYHSMYDTVLSLVSSQNETVLRTFAIMFSFLFSALVLIVIAKILNKFFETEKAQICWFLLVLPFIIPEMLFSSLIINPTNISFALILISHWFLIKFLKTNKRIAILLSILIFGLGVSFRWSNGFYLFVLFGYFAFSSKMNMNDFFRLNSLKKMLAIFLCYILSVVLWIQVSGYSVVDIIDVYQNGSSYLGDKEFSLLSSVASMISFTTPGFLILLIFGIYHCIKKKIYSPLIILFISSLPYFLLGFVPMYKFLITLVIPLLVIMIYAYKAMTHRVLKIGVFIIILLPWCLGIQIKSNSAWGPGFEVRSITNNELVETNFNPDKSIAFNNLNVVFGSGMAMPTSEGPRPLFGFGTVLLKDWFLFVNKNNSERESSVNYAIENNCNILQDVNHSYIASKLSENGYVPENEFNAASQFGIHRNFRTKDDSISIDVFENKKALFNTQLMNSYLSESDTNNVVIYVTYTNIMTKLQSKYGNQFQQKGAFWGILTLKE